MSKVKTSDQAAGVFALMGDGMRLIVPVGEIGIKLVPDPRIDYIANEPPMDVPQHAALELIRAGVIREITNRVEMFKGHEELVPEGAQVYAVYQMIMT